MLKGKLIDCLSKSWKLENKRMENIKNGFYYKRLLGGKNLGKCG